MMSPFEQKLDDVLNEATSLNPGTIYHRNGNVFKADHIRIVTGERGMKIIYVGIGPPQPPRVSGGGSYIRRHMIRLLPDFGRFWSGPDPHSKVAAIQSAERGYTTTPYHRDATLAKAHCDECVGMADTWYDPHHSAFWVQRKFKEIFTINAANVVRIDYGVSPATERSTQLSHP